MESAYRTFSEYAIARASGHDWLRIILSIDVFEKACSYDVCFFENDKKIQSQIETAIELDVALTNSALFLRDDLLINSGERMWGLEFILQKDGKFNITYDYNAPEWVNT